MNGTEKAVRKVQATNVKYPIFSQEWTICSYNSVSIILSSWHEMDKEQYKMQYT